MPKLTPEERLAMKSTGLFDVRPDGLCGDCGGYHLRSCPRVKKEVYLGNGNRVEVEYWEKWDEDQVIFIEDVYETQEDE